MAITLKAKNKIQTSMKGVHKIQDELTIQEFIDLHTDFIGDKRWKIQLRGLLRIISICLVSLLDGSPNHTGLMETSMKKIIVNSTLISLYSMSIRSILYMKSIS